MEEIPHGLHKTVVSLMTDHILGGTIPTVHEENQSVLRQAMLAQNWHPSFPDKPRYARRGLALGARGEIPQRLLRGHLLRIWRGVPTNAHECPAIERWPGY